MAVLSAAGKITHLFLSWLEFRGHGAPGAAGNARGSRSRASAAASRPPADSSGSWAWTENYPSLQQNEMFLCELLPQCW